jgi:hypothetical protein
MQDKLGKTLKIFIEAQINSLKFGKNYIRVLQISILNLHEKQTILNRISTLQG